MDNLNNQRTINAQSVFGYHFLDSKALYLYWFNSLPSIHCITSVDGEKAYAAFKERFGSLIASEHRYRSVDKKRKSLRFDETLLLLHQNCLVEFDNDYCNILHDGQQEAFVQECTELVSRFKESPKRRPLEINLIVSGNNGLELKTMEIKRTRLDLDLFYEDDFRAVDAVIRQRLNRKKDKGIVLLHGLPGTGKTTYLRYLVGRTGKRVLFLSPNVAGNLMNPEFIDLLIENPGTVVIIEDAEQIIMDRRSSGSSAVSNLLNISDGLLADFLNVQLVCTFNSPVAMVDSALLRKGRLIAQYEFGKLGIARAQRLSNHFGFDTVIDQPMTVAEISNQHEQTYERKTVQVIGFRREAVVECK